MVFAVLAIPSFVYYNTRVPETTIRYDLILAYPAMILAIIVIVFAFIRLLRQMVEEEQKEKAAASQDEASSSD